MESLGLGEAAAATAFHRLLIDLGGWAQHARWLLWQAGVLIGVFGAEILPRNWSLEFMATIALMVMLVPMARTRPMLLAALAGGLSAVLLRGLPLRLGLFAGIAIGIGTGFAAEHWQTRGEEK